MDKSYPPRTADGLAETQPEVRYADGIVASQVWEVVMNSTSPSGGSACADGRAAFVAHVSAETVRTGNTVIVEALKYCWTDYNNEFVPACTALGITIVVPEPEAPGAFEPGTRVRARSLEGCTGTVIHDVLHNPTCHSAINGAWLSGLTTPTRAVLVLFDATASMGTHISWMDAGELSDIER